MDSRSLRLVIPYSVDVIRFNLQFKCVYLDSTISDEDKLGDIPTCAKKYGREH